MHSNPLISIIIVHYNVYTELCACIESIYRFSLPESFEIIVVDNDEKHTIKRNLQKKFEEVIYIKNSNNGFGGGNNVGAKNAKGEYLFFLNPDTVVFKNTIHILYSFLNSYSKAGIVAPLLKHEDGSLFNQQGSRDLNPFNGVVVLSFINKIFPNNSVSRDYFLSEWNKYTLKKVDVVPGTAFMIGKKLFEKIGGFDEQFFMYFEESDICKRVQKIGYEMYMHPKSSIIHLSQRSTNKEKSTAIYKKSRYYYFKKHYGLVSALMIESFLLLNKVTLSLIFLIGILLLFWYNITI